MTVRAAIAVGLMSAGCLANAAACPQPVGPEVWFEVMGGNFRKDGLRLDLEAIRDAGFSGIHFFHIGRSDTGVWPGCEEQIPCLSEKWDDMVAFLGEECERLGLALTVQNCPGWSQSGGPWVPLSACQRDLVVAPRSSPRRSRETGTSASTGFPNR